MSSNKQGIYCSSQCLIIKYVFLIFSTVEMDFCTMTEKYFILYKMLSNEDLLG